MPAGPGSLGGHRWPGDLENAAHPVRPGGGRRRSVVLTDQATLCTELTRLVRQLAGDSPPPLRPLW